MPILKQNTFRGLNLRDSDINRSPEYASDCENILLDSRRQLIKRYGFDFVATPGYSLLDLMGYKNFSELIAISPTGPRKLSSGSFLNINLGGSLPTNGWSGVDYDEYNNVLYFTDLAGKTDLFKYDGYMAYRAGIPQVSATTGAGAGAKYYRLAYYFIDGQGNIHWGDYKQFGPIAAGATFTVDTFNGTEYYAKGAISSSVQTIDSGNLTASVSSGHNFVPGDFIRALDSSLSVNEFKMLEVDSVNATSITFTAASVGSGSFVYGSGEPIERRLHCAIFISDNATYGYYQDLTVDYLISHVATKNITSTGASSTPMEDIYDTTAIKGLPPRSKYIKIYGYTMVLGNRINQQQTSTDLTDYSASQIGWSDTGVGSTVETFPPFNRQQIGKSSEGDISGLFSSENELIVFKDSQVYYIHGILIGRAFRLTSALTGGIGCKSHRSIVEVDGGCLFQSSRGIYFAGGGKKPIEISDLIEPIFTEDTSGLDLTSCRAVRDTAGEKVLFFIPATSSADNLVIVYDYYHREWFKFKNYDCSGGFLIVNNTTYHSNGTSLFSSSSSYNDNGSAILAFYKTGWFHFGFPSLVKKVTRAVIFSIGAIAWMCRIKSQKNYLDIDDTNITHEFKTIDVLEDKPLNPSNCYSLRLVFEGELINQGMLINGYEIEYEPNQKMTKGDS